MASKGLSGDGRNMAASAFHEEEMTRNVSKTGWCWRVSKASMASMKMHQSRSVMKASIENDS